ncbi:hypothetical protein [Ensifer sp. B1-9]|uniref:hypothetical protein n=1 Tax=Ensifer sp. B1-9 TaxID=3141455 RepID=UPI003D23D56A
MELIGPALVDSAIEYFMTGEPPGRHPGIVAADPTLLYLVIAIQSDAVSCPSSSSVVLKAMGAMIASRTAKSKAGAVRTPRDTSLDY